ncbi:barstar family protein [Rathayibacter toxicus]|uniref:barstar family protein n=1 Tax=Rathayibacter toxicus TaxID=145458 RepID=UPI000CE8DD78|nr:barstar family protein [Rathayibacter toxicus]PPI54086.1 hypothetical protein C5D35_07055 [Rathayibacter toxicus]QOD11218.1 barstar family protein [Rathayibacter toxicus]QWL27960.1 hypothetical protein E2R33_04545 [Rathayibacter toxicus]
MQPTPWSNRPDVGLSAYFIHADASFCQQLTDFHELHGYYSRRLRGDKMMTQSALYDEFAAGLQFPYYFGENRNAFDECISDLGDRDVGKGVSISISDCDLILKKAPLDAFAFLLDSLRRAGNIWGTPIKEQQSWDREAKPFIITLFSQDEDYSRIEEKWSSYEITVNHAPIPKLNVY